MKFLEDKILQEGSVLQGDILSVSSFLNTQIDPKFMQQIGNAFYSLFKDDNVTKILTIEASGIAIASFTSISFNKPFVFAKKRQSKNLTKDVYTSTVHSYTYDKDYTIAVPKEFLKESDNVLIIDDFLANGMAVRGLIDIVQQANANLVGIGICIEKAFQDGGKSLREDGYRVESLAKVQSLSTTNITFTD